MYRFESHLDPFDGVESHHFPVYDLETKMKSVKIRPGAIYFYLDLYSHWYVEPVAQNNIEYLTETENVQSIEIKVIEETDMQDMSMDSLIASPPKPQLSNLPARRLIRFISIIALTLLAKSKFNQGH